ncbi:hypothetical protein HDU78_003412 [Chytriomyces hyalinus]|nr:hypothetical protein HDU78_003412 [Chytriomyces hyalinus]
MPSVTPAFVIQHLETEPKYATHIITNQTNFTLELVDILIEYSGSGLRRGFLKPNTTQPKSLQPSETFSYEIGDCRPSRWTTCCSCLVYKVNVSGTDVYVYLGYYAHGNRGPVFLMETHDRTIHKHINGIHSEDYSYTVKNVDFRLVCNKPPYLEDSGPIFEYVISHGSAITEC